MKKITTTRIVTLTAGTLLALGSVGAAAAVLAPRHVEQVAAARPTTTAGPTDKPGRVRPTDSPTVAPTVAPTAAATTAPTATATTTAAPTTQPMTSPSSALTAAPPPPPTVAPTAAPAASPTPVYPQAKPFTVDHCNARSGGTCTGSGTVTVYADHWTFDVTINSSVVASEGCPNGSNCNAKYTVGLYTGPTGTCTSAITWTSAPDGPESTANSGGTLHWAASFAGTYRPQDLGIANACAALPA